jgi:hypothetical protein
VPGVSDRATEASVCGLPADMVAKCTGRCVRLLDYCILWLWSNSLYSIL